MPQANAKSAAAIPSPFRDSALGHAIRSLPMTTPVREMMVETDGKSASNRKARRAARKEGKLDTTAFLKVADKFIDLANRENNEVQATDLHMAFLFAAARYNAFVAKTVLNIDEHEPFVEHMAAQYRDMLRQHLGDASLEPPEG